MRKLIVMIAIIAFLCPTTAQAQGPTVTWTIGAVLCDCVSLQREPVKTAADGAIEVIIDYIDGHREVRRLEPDVPGTGWYSRKNPVETGIWRFAIESDSQTTRFENHHPGWVVTSSIAPNGDVWIVDNARSVILVRGDHRQIRFSVVESQKPETVYAIGEGNSIFELFFRWQCEFGWCKDAIDIRVIKEFQAIDPRTRFFSESRFWQVDASGQTIRRRYPVFLSMAAR